MTHSGVDAVVFDWGGTLTPWHALDPRAAWAAAVSDEELADRLWQAEIEMWVRSRDEHRSATIDEVFVRVGVTPTPAMLDAISRWWEPHTFLDPDAPLLFDGLRERGIKIGVLSNTLWTRAEHERIFARDGVLGVFDGAVYTSEIAWTKPHTEAFRAALDSVGVDDPASAVFVGDRPFDDIHGAKSAGMRAVLVPHSDIPADQEGPVRGEADAIIQRLGDLIDVVDAWAGRTPGR
ncbi:MAG: HAD family hydrolase [Jatrophihabitans sp.]